MISVRLFSGALIAAASVCVTGWNASAAESPDGVWRAVAPSKAAPSTLWVQPEAFAPFTLDAQALEALLRPAPREGSKSAGAVVFLPMPDGSFSALEIHESPIMAPELEAKYPDIKTYLGRGIDLPGVSARLDRTPRGFHAQVIGPEGLRVCVDPYRKDGSVYAAYHAQEYGNEEVLQCLTVGEARRAKRAVGAKALPTGTMLRTYRAAITCTGEYGQFHGGTVADAMAGIVTTINRVTQILERELTVRLELVAQNDQLIFLDPETDPYTANNKSILLREVAPVVNGIIGEDAYDITHVLNGAPGGVAFLDAVCRGLGGVSGSNTPIGDPYDVNLVAHEMGHQFGASHTFNGIRASCASNRSGAHAFEPGSGSTIMSYGRLGLCFQDNLPGIGAPMYHAHSIDQMLDYVDAGSGSNCAALTPTGNTPPTAEAGPAYTLPAATPFTLTGAATDPDDDTLSYSWEQMDLGPQAKLEANDDGEIPLFRAFDPSLDPARTFPRLPVILETGNVDLTTQEKLPQVSRVMNFRFTVRDNAAGGGGVAGDGVAITVEGGAGPFRVTGPDTCAETAGDIDITWNVANTDQPPINTETVNILLSTDGGQTFPTALASATPNDGLETVTLPDTDTASARIKVEAVDNIFFDISDENFIIGSAGPCPPDVPSPVPNDDCSGAIDLTDCTAFSGTLDGARGSTPSSCGAFDFNDVWFRYTAAEDGDILVSTCGSTFDTTLEVFDACGGTSLGCDDDSCGRFGEQAELQLPVISGEDYFIRVAGSGNQGGTGSLEEVLAVQVIPLGPTGESECPVVEGPMPPEPGVLDFCGEIDDSTLQMNLPFITGLFADDLPELAELLNNLTCATADVNGPVLNDLPTGNGVLDEYELAIVEAIYNNPDFDLNGLTHAQLVAVFETNYQVVFEAVEEAIAESGFESFIDALDPRLNDRLAIIFGGYATLADAQTQGAIQVVLDLLGSLGATPPPLSAFDFSLGGVVGVGGDVDADDCGNTEEYLGFGAPADGTPEDYLAAVLDPGVETAACAEFCPDEPLQVALVGNAAVEAAAGGPLELAVEACGPSGNLDYQWRFKATTAGAFVNIGANAPVLVRDPIGPADAGEYVCEVSDGFDAVTSSPYTVTVETSEGEGEGEGSVAEGEPQPEGEGQPRDGEPAAEGQGVPPEGEIIVPDGEPVMEGEDGAEGATPLEAEPVFDGEAEEGEGEGTTTEGAQEEGEGVAAEGETAEGEGEDEGNGEGESAAEGEGEGAAGTDRPHSADLNGDFVISWSELLRVLQFYSIGGYGCAAGDSEDGYIPGPGGQNCRPHDSDFAPQNWAIGLNELLRLIQFYNAGGYARCDTTADGFCTPSAAR